MLQLILLYEKSSKEHLPKLSLIVYPLLALLLWDGQPLHCPHKDTFCGILTICVPHFIFLSCQTTL
jgi:hypothetical protein